jgi:hypothetical protein
MTEKMFYGDLGNAYRVQELVVSPELLADDHGLAMFVRAHLEGYAAVVVRVLNRAADQPSTVNGGRNG